MMICYTPDEELIDAGAVTMVPMSEYTTFKVGGPADIGFFPKSEEELMREMRLLKERDIPVTIVGGGSNLLVGDNGIRGAVIILRGIKEMSVSGDILSASCGVSLPRTARLAADSSISGFEFASGIPGSVGGSLVMNAGAYGSEMKDIVLSCRVLSPDGTVRTVMRDDMGLGYRTSVFSETDDVILSAVYRLVPGDRDEIVSRMKELAEKRRASQPLEYASAGSTFKRPAEVPAAKLIDDAGLKGESVGGAMVSTKHAGFIVNTGNATASDVLELISKVTDRVLSFSGIRLEPEVKIVGSFIKDEL